MALEHFRAFANAHFETFEKSIEQKNHIHLHQCCFTFTNKYTRSKLKYPHPKRETMTYWDFKRWNNVSDIETFAAALMKLAHNGCCGDEPKLPTYNSEHLRDPLSKRDYQPSSLAMILRIAELEEDIDELRKEHTALQTKYQEVYEYMVGTRRTRDDFQGKVLLLQHLERAYIRWFLEHRLEIDLDMAWETAESIAESEAAHRRRSEEYTRFPDPKPRDIEIDWNNVPRPPTNLIPPLEIKVAKLSCQCPTSAQSALPHEQYKSLYLHQRLGLNSKALSQFQGPA